MALTYTEMDAITDDYFLINNGEAVDNYFDTSYLLNLLLKEQKGIWERPSGGMKIRIPIEYDEGVAEFYAKGDTISSDDRDMINSAAFDWKHAYANATVYRIDGLKNTGEYGQVQLITQRVKSAQKTITKMLAGSIYDAPGGSSNRLTGLLALCNETSTLAYGDIAEDDLVSSDGTKVWEGKVDTTAESVSLNVIRDMCSDAKVRDGKGGKPDLIVTTETLWNEIADVLQAQQRFTNSESTAKAGFTGLNFEGKDIFPDDYCPSGYAFALNTNNIGFAVHKEGLFMRTKWKVIPDSAEDKTMKIYFDGNMVCNLRKAHEAHSNLS